MTKRGFTRPEVKKKKARRFRNTEKKVEGDHGEGGP